MEEFLNLNYDWAHSKIICESPAKPYQFETAKSVLNLWYGALPDLNRISKTVREVQNRIELILPETCQNYAKQIAELVGEQLTELIKLLNLKNLLTENQISWHFMKDKLHWTLQGSINKKSTAEALAGAIDLNVETRFRIAVTFCLEDRINSLSVYLPTNYVETRRDDLLVIGAMDVDSIARKHFHIKSPASDFTEYFQGHYSSHFTKALREKNDLASAYFWQFLTEQNKQFHFDAIKKRGEDFCFYSHYTLFMLTHCNNEKKSSNTGKCNLFYLFSM